jgi:uncharacterized RDD family membrane protein YckC
VDVKTDRPAPTGLVLGTLNVSLLVDPATGRAATATQIQMQSDRVAREAVLALAALLFAQRQVGAVNDPSRLATVDELTALVAAARAQPLAPRLPVAGSRTAATYRVTLLAESGFRIEVEERLPQLQHDAAGQISTAALSHELLATLNDPYRTFFLEMIEAALAFWKARRPSLIESTWDWTVALRRLNALVQTGGAPEVPPATCAACGAARPANSACLHCGASATQGPAPASALTASVPYVPPPAPTPPPAPAAPVREPEVAFAAPAAPPPVPPVAPAADEPERTIVPAKEIEIPEPEPDPRLAWPLAGFLSRLVAAVIDLIAGVLLGLIGGFGLTSIVAASGGFGPGDSPQTFFLWVALVIAALYFTLGWTRSETLGSLVFRLAILRADNRQPGGFVRAVRRAVGYVVLLALAGAVFYGLNAIDNQLIFIEGTADLVVRIIIGLITLYILWLGTGQPILSGNGRQTIGDKFADTLVTVRKS